MSRDAGRVDGVRVVVRKGGKSDGNTSQHTPVDGPNTLRSLATASIVEVLSEGVIAGLHAPPDHPLQAVYLDGTPAENEAGVQNARVPTFVMQPGWPDQDVLPGFADQENVVSVGTQLLAGLPLVRAVTPGTDAVRVIVQVDALYFLMDQGDIAGTDVGYTISYRQGPGDWVQAAYIDIGGKTSSPYQQSTTIYLPPGAVAVDIQVERMSPAPPDDHTQNNISWVGYVEIVDVKLKYDDTAVVGTSVDAHYFPNVPTRGFLIDGITVQVPSNYDPVARTYAGDWDGTFKVAFSNNPAWVLYDLLTNPRYGCGRDIDASAVDKWGFYEAAQYNDELVPDGYGTGGSEPRFTCNCVINTQQDAFTVLGAVASSMRSTLYYSNGVIGLVQDRPQPAPTRLFGPANIVGGLPDYAGTDFRSMFVAAAITWNSPQELYTQVTELVLDQGLVATQDYRDTGVVAFGCTSRGQAIRLGRFLIYTSQYETELVTIRTSLENADVRPGEVILLNDPTRAGARLAGRTLDDPGPDTITFDKQAEAVAPGWTIYVVVGSAADAATPTIHALIVSEVLGYDQVRVSGKPPSVPPGAMWLASDPTVEPTPWRVLSIKDNGNQVFEILASFYSEGKYPYVDSGTVIPPPSFSLIPKGPLAPPTGIGVKEYIYVDGAGTIQFGAVISWQASSDPRVAFYVLELSGPNYDNRQFRNIAGTTQDVAALRQGTWIINVTAVDNLGRLSIALSESYTTIGLTAKPLPPIALYGHVVGDTIVLEWMPTAEIDVLYYWIAWHPETDGSASWWNATTVATRIARNQTRISVPERAGTYFIKTVDSLGQESADAAECIIYTDTSPPNEIITLSEQPAWAGTSDLWAINGLELRLDPPAAQEAVPTDVYPGSRGTAINGEPTRYSYYDFASAFDMGISGVVTLSVNLTAYGTQGDVTMSTWVPLAVAVPLAQGQSNNWDASVEVRTTLDGATWGDWRPITRATLTVWTAQFRLVGMTYDLATAINVIACEISIDVPDRVDSGDDVPFDGGGVATVTYAPAFAVKPNLQVTGFAPSINQGTSVQITGSDKYGFTARQVRDNGQAVGGGSFNWMAHGYGVSA